MSFVKAIVAITGSLFEIPQFPYTRKSIYKKNTYDRKVDRREIVARSVVRIHLPQPKKSEIAFAVSDFFVLRS